MDFYKSRNVFSGTNKNETYSDDDNDLWALYYYYIPRAREWGKKKHNNNNNNNKYQKRVSLARRNFSFVDNNGLGSCSGAETYRPTPISCEKIILYPTGCTKNTKRPRRRIVLPGYSYIEGNIILTFQIII